MKQLHDTLAADAAGTICYRYYKEFNNTEGDRWYKTAIELYTAGKRAVRAGLFSLELGRMVTRDYNFEKGISFILSSLKLFEQAGEINNQVRANNTLALAYHDFGFYDKSIACAEAAIKMLDTHPESTNRNYYWYAYNNMGISYDDSKQYAKAIASHLKALPFAIDASDSAYSYNNLGNTHKKLGELQTSSLYFHKAMESSKSLVGDEYHMSSIFSNLVDIERRKQNYKQAREYLPLAQMYAEKSGSPEKKLDYYYYAHLLEKETGNRSASLAYLEQFVALKDSFFTKEKNQAVLQLQTLYDFEKKERELSEAKLKLVEEENQSRQKNSALIILGLSILAIVLFFRTYKARAKAREQQLLLQNQLAEEQGRLKIHQQRLEISRELHDSLGSQLTFINSTLSNLKAGGSTESVAISKKLNALSEFSDSSIAELRNALWVLNTEKIYLEDLRLKFLNFINKAAEAKEQVEFSFKAKLETNPLLNSKAASNLFRVFQEIINNAIKHAEASRISVFLQQEHGVMVLLVEDDGIGFDYAHVKGKSYGLNNIESRLAECNASLKVDTAPNRGTTYRLTVNMES